MRVWTSFPTRAGKELPGYDFDVREEQALEYEYYDEDGALVEGGVLERDINRAGWVDVPLKHLAMEDVRTFRMSFDAGFRGGLNIPYVEITDLRKP